MVVFTAGESILAQSVIQAAREQPAHAEHIDGRANGAIAETVFASAEATRSMMHRNFNETKTRRADQRRNETVHTFEWHEHGDAFAAHRLECATGVAHVIL